MNKEAILNTTSYKEDVIERLQDPEFARIYLETAFELYQEDDTVGEYQFVCSNAIHCTLKNLCKTAINHLTTNNHLLNKTIRQQYQKMEILTLYYWLYKMLQKHKSWINKNQDEH